MWHAKKTWLNPWFRVVALSLISVAVAGVLSGTLPTYILFVSTTILVTTVALLGLGVVSGTAGMISLAQLTFAGIGAWFTEFLILQTDLPKYFGSFAFLAAMIIGALITSGFGVLFGLPALRLRGVNLAVIGLGIAAAGDATFMVIGMPDQVRNEMMPRPFGIGNDAAGDRGYFLFAAAVLIIVGLVVYLLQRGRWGSAWKSVAFSERGTASSGQSVVRAKLSAFWVSAMLASISGSLLVGQIGKVNAMNFTALGSLVLYALALVVGAQLLDMALFGGVLFVVIPEILKLLRVPLEWASLFFAVSGIQAIVSGASFGQTLRNLAARRQVVPTELSLGTKVSQPSLTSRETSVPAGTGRTVLSIRGLTVEYGAVKALADVNIDFEELAITGLIGPNGAGKSTLIDALSGFIPQHRGEVEIDGKTLSRVPAYKIPSLGLRRTFQQDRVPTSLTVGAYARFVSHGLASRNEVAEALEFFGCPSLQEPMTRVDVSTRRLIEVAANVVSRPKILLLDEPAAGLSHDAHVDLAQCLRQVPSLYGTTIILVDHDVELIRAVCKNVVVLDFGNVIAQGPASRVLSDPVVLKAYMGDIETA